MLGATGLVGQRLVARLGSHPIFEPVAVAASEDRAGTPYDEAVTWRINEPLPDSLTDLELDVAEPGTLSGDPDLVLSALPGGVAEELEPAFARDGTFVCSNASPERMADDVPLIIPEINEGHLDLIEHQRSQRGWSGALIKNPNCMTTTITLPLAALLDFGIEHAAIVSMQAISGAGTGGVHGVDIVDNVLPDIPGEADKLATEPHKLLGTLDSEGIEPRSFTVDAACHRVPVIDGHMATCFITVEDAVSTETIQSAFEGYPGVDLPSAPDQPIQVVDEPRRPQPRYDRDAGAGMAVTVGPVEIDGPRIGYTCLAHNTVRGAAGACLLAAESAAEAGYLG